MKDSFGNEIPDTDDQRRESTTILDGSLPLDVFNRITRDAIGRGETVQYDRDENTATITGQRGNTVTITHH